MSQSYTPLAIQWSSSFIIFHFKQCFLPESPNICESKAFFSVSSRTQDFDERCSSWSPSVGLAVTQGEPCRGLGAVPHPQNSLTTETSSWFEASDGTAIRNGRIRNFPFCLDIRRRFQMPKHGEQKPHKGTGTALQLLSRWMHPTRSCEAGRLTLQLHIPQFFLPEVGSEACNEHASAQPSDSSATWHLQ